MHHVTQRMKNVYRVGRSWSLIQVVRGAHVRQLVMSLLFVKIEPSNIHKLVFKHFSAHLAPQVGRCSPGHQARMYLGFVKRMGGGLWEPRINPSKTRNSSDLGHYFLLSGPMLRT